MDNLSDRRDFLRKSAAGAGLALAFGLGLGGCDDKEAIARQEVYNYAESLHGDYVSHVLRVQGVAERLRTEAQVLRMSQEGTEEAVENNIAALRLDTAADGLDSWLAKFFAKNRDSLRVLIDTDLRINDLIIAEIDAANRRLVNYYRYFLDHNRACMESDYTAALELLGEDFRGWDI